MPIEFSCPTCRQLVRTPDGTAGKKGKCPQCGAVVQIPLASASDPAVIKIREALSNSTPTLKDATSYITPNTLNAGTIDFQLRGMRPGSAGAGCLGGQERPVPRVRGRHSQIPQVGKGIDFSAPGSGAETPDSAIAGYLGPRLPAGKTSAWKIPPVDGLIPLNDRGASGSELIPLHGGPPVGSAFPPAGHGGRALPHPPPAPPPQDPLANLAPIPEDELFKLQRAPMVNPFSAPAESEAPVRRAPRYKIDDRNRGGLPWEQCPSMDAFGDTILVVVSAPDTAFSRMRRFGGIGNPMGFLVAALVLNNFLLLIEAAIVYLGYLFLFQGGQNWEAVVIGLGIFGLGNMIGAVVSATVGGLIQALFYHVLLMIFGAAKGGFEATYRVVAFGTGSITMLLPIPIVGVFFALVMMPIVMIYGFMHAHETDGWRAAAVVLLPAVLALCLLGVIFLFALTTQATG